MLNLLTNFIFKKDLDKITALYPYSYTKKCFNKIIVDIDSDTDNIYQIKFIKHLSGSITCVLINDWCDFQVDFDKYGYKKSFQHFCPAVQNTSGPPPGDTT